MKTRIFILILLAARFLPGLAQAYQVQEAMRDYRYREAIALLERAPESVENELLKAECYQKLYDYPAALDIYESLIAGNHETIRILTAAADCATQAGDHETSLRYWLKACELSPGNLYLQRKWLPSIVPMTGRVQSRPLRRSSGRTPYPCCCVLWEMPTCSWETRLVCFII
jgi:tetratricopeptide (TPR) repeat protein